MVLLLLLICSSREVVVLLTLALALASGVARTKRVYANDDGEPIYPEQAKVLLQ